MNDKIRLTEELEQFINKQGFTNGILFCINQKDARILVVNPGTGLHFTTQIILSEVVEFFERKKMAHVTEMTVKKGFDTSQDF